MNPSDRSTPVDSEDDLPPLPRSEFAATVDPSSSSMQLLAENLKKLEKSGKLKNWGNTNFGDRLGDKFKSARRSSKKFAGYALSKLGGQGTILRRKRSPKSKEGGREVHSDTEEGDELSTSSTPLLQSMSASTHNLTLSAVPPPKPPRTFKTKMLGQVANQCPIEDDEEEGLLRMSKEDDFSTDVLNALKKVTSVLDQCEVEGEEGEGEGKIATSSDTKVILNGRLPSITSEELEYSFVKRSESSPLLSQAAASSQDEESGSNSLQRSSHSIGLQPIAEAKGEALDVIDGERLVSSVPLRRRAGTTPLAMASLPTSQSFTSAAEIKGDIVEVKGDTMEVKGDAVGVKGDNTAEIEEDDDLGEFMDDSALGDANRSDKRLSMMSVTSAEFFSAASSEANSTAASPDFLRHGVVSPPTAVASSILLDTDENRARVTSSASADEEYFSTPPSSPNPVDQADKMESIEPEVSIDIVDTAATLTRETAAAVMKEKEEEENRKEREEGESEERKEREGGEIEERKEREGGESEERKEKEEGGESEEIQTTPVKKSNRKRSLTLSESMPFPVTVGVGSPGLIKTMSKDDNFQTEYHHLFKSKDEPDSGGLATSFSTQDLAEILGSGKSILPALAIETVKEEPSLAKEEDTPSLNEEQPSLKGEEEKGESASMADRSASPTGTCSSLGGSTSPEIIEPVIIPDDITPNMVRE